ncbi:sugar transferase [Croceicoccus sp. Ery15]|uniref:sugar transferase n=1 Tax=Croceicoccus sp. Ery15 TaxID=1703338 RepID=UPI001E2C1471|nr:sugar transferase [Croceicoccus sp. Ery15]
MVVSDMYLEVTKNIVDPAVSRKVLPRVSDRRFQRIRCYLALAMSDLFALTFAFIAANLIYLGSPLDSHGIALLSVMIPNFFCFAAINAAYGGEPLLSRECSVTRSMQAVVFASTAVALMIFLLKAGNDISRAVFLIGVVLSVLTVPLARLGLFGQLLKHMSGTPYSKVVIVDGRPYQGTADEIVLSAHDIGFNPVSSDPHGFHALASAVTNADRIVVVTEPKRYANWSAALKGIAIKGEILTAGDDELGIVGTGRHHNLPTLVISNGPLTLRERLMKRVFDLVVASVGLLACAPILIVTAIAIKLETPGPVLFRQSRIGRDNKIFEMRKFRSMYTDRCDAHAGQLTTQNDPRVTKVGNFIRRTSIDELPQLINVLRGEMSIVGPRPHAMSAKAANKLYWDVDTRYRNRHSMKPGLTGLAQVRGFRGPTDRTDDLKNRLMSDLEYVDRWSIWLDLYLVIRTFTSLFGKNAF